MIPTYPITWRFLICALIRSFFLTLAIAACGSHVDAPGAPSFSDAGHVDAHTLDASPDAEPRTPAVAATTIDASPIVIGPHDAGATVDACGGVSLPACLMACVAEALDAGADAHDLDGIAYEVCKSACYACSRP